MESAILQTLDRDGVIPDTGDYASASGYDHNALVNSVKSLSSCGMVKAEVPFALSDHRDIHSMCPPCMCPPCMKPHLLLLLQDISHSRYVLTAEAQQYLEQGSPEAQVYAAVPPAGISLAELQKQLGPIAGLGFAQAKIRKWLDLDKSRGAPLIVRKVNGACFVMYRACVPLHAAGEHGTQLVNSKDGSCRWRA